MAKKIRIKIFVPNCDDQREKILEDAIEAAQENLGVSFEVWPIDNRAMTAIMSSSNAESIVEKIVDNGYNPSEISIFILRKDVHTDNTNFCFGATIGQMIVISDFRVWHSVTNHAVKTAMLAYLLEHEIGHVFGIADDNYDQGIYDKHCKDESCVMRQVINVEQLAEFAKQNIVQRTEPGCYCKHCQKRFDLFCDKA